MKCLNSWCPGTISKNYDCLVCGHVLDPRAKHVVGVAAVAALTILAVAHAEEREAIQELVIMLASKSGMSTNGLESYDIDATIRRGAILRAASKRSKAADPWPEYGASATGFAVRAQDEERAIKGK